MVWGLQICSDEETNFILDGLKMSPIFYFGVIYPFNTFTNLHYDFTLMCEIHFNVDDTCVVFDVCRWMLRDDVLKSCVCCVRFSPVVNTTCPPKKGERRQTAAVVRATRKTCDVWLYVVVCTSLSWTFRERKIPCTRSSHIFCLCCCISIYVSMTNRMSKNSSIVA